MEIIIVNLNDLELYEKNAKIHTEEQIEQIANSIKELGFNDPIAINKDNRIIEGHGRYLACKKLGIEQVPCIRLLELTEEQEQAYIIAHNKLTMNTGFDMEKLELVLNDLQLTDFDVTLTGFTQEEIDSITQVDDEIDFDEFLGEERHQTKEKVCPHCGGRL